MAEIYRPEESFIFKNWGKVNEKPKLIYSAWAEFDSSNIGKLPSHQWIIPDQSDWEQ